MIKDMQKNVLKPIANREVKSDAFTAHFGNPKNAAQLYAALEGEEVSPEDIQFTTLEGVLFVARKNDLAFTAKGKVLVISEHQSTINPNMPLRSAIYYGRTMEKLIDPRAIYGKKLMRIPTPEFYCFYNGNEPQPPEMTLKLSTSYLAKTSEPMLELSVRVININLPENHQILEQCRPLYEYSWFIQRVKDYIALELPLDDAITKAIEACRAAGILVDFLQEYGSEVYNMLFKQFDVEEALEYRYNEGVEDGLERGIEQGIERGRLLTLIDQVCRKLAKGKSAQEIAEDLEEEQELIEKVCETAEICGYPVSNPDLSAELKEGICRQLQEM